MKREYYKCEMCRKEARGEKQLRKENWLRIKGGLGSGVHVWLSKPREKNAGYMIHIGYAKKDYDFCSIDCLVKALEGKKSM